MHPFVQLIAVIWLGAALCCIGGKSAKPAGEASLITLLAGIGYVIYKSRN